MFPWMMNPGGLPSTPIGGPLSLLQMYQQSPPQPGGFFAAQNNQRSPQMWWQSYQSPDRSDQRGNRNQSDPGNAMAPPGQVPPGGPDSNPQAGYDYNTVSPGYDPGWMSMFARGRRPNMNQSVNMGTFGLSMLQPRPPARSGPYPWI